ncbi:MAG: type IV toxin-antitoxin system AbiEi family antitoxin domain-containing protein, partial [Acidimicrobiia bacterium]|nr:type IV toxin-antitoxin system AbiEi family antitoxin domain-containing protein [Acidimicrobiia bacterium]
MPKGRAINQLASEQGGIILRTQAIAAGMATSTIDRRVSSGTWWTVRPGVYRLFESRGETDDLRAAVTALPNAVVSHFSAGRMHGLGA